MNKLVVLIISVILFTSFASATFEVSNSSINTEYVAGDYISGWINLSLDNEQIDTAFSDSEGNKISLMEFANKANYVYTCSINGCLSDYTKDGEPETSKAITLGADEEKIVGFYLTGSIEEIKSISFNITSDVMESSTNQLKIDILNDGKIDTGNTRISNNPGSSKNFGVYNDSEEEVKNPQLTSEPVCQEVMLKESPGLDVGSWIRKIGTGDNDIEMSLYDSEGEKLEKCIINSTDITESGVDVSCLVDVLIPEEGKYFVCMERKTGTANYVVKAYSSKVDSKNGGFKGTPSSSTEKIGSYFIFAQPRNFDRMGTISIQNKLPSLEQFSDLAQEYMEDKYPSLDCSKTDCFIPIKLISTKAQEITIDNIVISLEDSLGVSTQNKIYSLNESLSKMSGEYQKVNIDGIFKTKTKTESITYKLKFGDKEIIKELIQKKLATFNLFPMQTVSNYPTEFAVSPIIDEIVSKYSWDFGDNVTTTEIKNTTTHTYKKEGQYNIKIIFTTISGKELTRNFPITVSSPKALIKSEIERMEKDISSMKIVFNTLSTTEKSKLSEVFNFTQTEKAVAELKAESLKANDSESYNSLVGKILALDVPSKLVKTPAQKVPFFPSSDLIKLEDLREITKEQNDSHSDSEVRDAIIFWEKRNLNLLISTSDLTITKKDTESLVLRTFEITISPIGKEKQYYVIFSPNTLEYSNPSELKDSSDAVYLKMLGEKVALSFSTKSDIDFKNLPITIAPKISDLALVSKVIEEEEVKSKTGIIIISFIILLLVAIGIYAALHSWYKSKYEKYLFQDKTNLYNVMIYVNNCKSQGIPNDEIKKSLSRSGWSGEQIRYIMRKFEGRETGMRSLLPKSSSNQTKNKPQDTQFNSSEPQPQGIFKNQRHKL